MDDPRAAEGVEHLQTAAKELLLAARSFLNVVEEVVEDRDRFAGAATDIVGLLRDGLQGAMASTAPLQPWEQAAWRAGSSPDDAEDPEDLEDADAAGGATCDGAGDPAEPDEAADPHGAAHVAGDPAAGPAPVSPPAARTRSTGGAPGRSTRSGTSTRRTTTKRSTTTRSTTTRSTTKRSATTPPAAPDASGDDAASTPAAPRRVRRIAVD